MLLVLIQKHQGPLYMVLLAIVGDKTGSCSKIPKTLEPLPDIEAYTAPNSYKSSFNFAIDGKALNTDGSKSFFMSLNPSISIASTRDVRCAIG